MTAQRKIIAHATPEIVGYRVTNTRTGKVTFYTSSRRTSDAMDRADAAYGACCTVRKAIWSDEA